MKEIPMTATLMEAREALWDARHELFEQARNARIDGDDESAVKLWRRIDEMSAQLRQAEIDMAACEAKERKLVL